MNKMKVVQIGLGPLGQKITQFIAQREGLEVIGAIDVSPEIIDKDIGELCGLDNMDIKIQSSIGECLRSTRPDADMLQACSRLARAMSAMRIKSSSFFGLLLANLIHRIRLKSRELQRLNQSLKGIYGDGTRSNIPMHAAFND